MTSKKADDSSLPRVWLCGAEDWGKWLGVICPMTWRALYPTDDPTIRFCAECRRNVHLCESPEQFVELSNSKECVALLPQILMEAERNYATPHGVDEALLIPFLGMPKKITRDEIDRIRYLSALNAFGVSIRSLPVFDKTRRGEKSDDV